MSAEDTQMIAGHCFDLKLSSQARPNCDGISGKVRESLSPYEFDGAAVEAGPIAR